MSKSAKAAWSGRGNEHARRRHALIGIIRPRWTGLPTSTIRWFFDSEYGLRERLIPRWIFLRALGLIYFSAFFSLVFQIRGLIGADGILPSNEYLAAVTHQFGVARFWFAPTLLWLSTGPHLLTAICWVGMIASLLLAVNFWPRGMLVICFVCFLSFVSAAQDFSGYQSDGMLLEAGFISLFFAPPGLLPGLGRKPSNSRLVSNSITSSRNWFPSGRVGTFSNRYSAKLSRIPRPFSTASCCRIADPSYSNLALQFLLPCGAGLKKRPSCSCGRILSKFQRLRAQVSRNSRAKSRAYRSLFKSVALRRGGYIPV
jgi:hypothetical protein